MPRVGEKSESTRDFRVELGGVESSPSREIFSAELAEFDSGELGEIIKKKFMVLFENGEFWWRKIKIQSRNYSSSEASL